MKQALLIRSLIAASATVLFLLAYLWERKKGRHGGLSMGIAAPILLLLVLPATYFLTDSIKYLQTFLSFLVSYAVYSALLLALTPLLRKRYSAELCADLWLLPNVSYFAFLYLSDLLVPFAVLRIGSAWFWALLYIWAAGFLAVLGWKIVEHLRFRRRLLKRATQDDYLSYVYAERRYSILSELDRERSRLPDRKAIVCSPDAVSPLSVGLFRAKIVLPRKRYTDEELDLILRHETTHLIRDDNGTKFFLAFMSACYWFFPFSWLGLSRAAEDLELCCDELATARLNPEERKRYAELLLSNAGAAPGFTTCLSAAASGLRYRRQRICRPVRAKSGFALLAVMMFLFLFSLQAVCLAPSVGGMTRVAFAKIPETDSITMSFGAPRERWDAFSCDEAALRSALAKTEVFRADGCLDGDIVFRETKMLTIKTVGKTRAVEVVCYETFAYAYSFVINGDGSWEPTEARQTYLYGEPPDWDALYALAAPLPTE